jgi:murein DD-endopeptidase MepM/ murein hydrolase activator NlpD
MVADTSGWGSAFFPEIRVRFRSSAPTILSPRLQAGMLSCVLIVAAVLAYLGVSRLSYEHLLAKREAEAARAQTAKSDLENRIGGLRQKLTALAQDRDQAKTRAATLAGQAGTLRTQLSLIQTKLQSQTQIQSQLAQQQDKVEQQPTTAAADTASKAEQARILDQAQRALQQEKTQNAALTAQLDKIQADRAAEAAQFVQYKANLEEAARELEQLGRDRGGTSVRRARVHVQLGEIWRKLSQILPPQPAAPAAVAALPALGGAAASGGSGAGGDLGRAEVDTLERALRSVGVDVTRIVSSFATTPAEGGPFVPPPKPGQSAADAVSPEKLAAIEALAKTLPVSAPLVQYSIGSPFGRRIDPFNRRLSFHTGVDMDAPYSSPVFATASGTVIYSGWLGDYGQVVEIDHGFGIVTLYAHLRRCLVSAGQTVAAQAEIGLVGTTGRSTGAHVHYEVRVDGQPQDPEKFLDLARLLPAATRQVTPAVGGPAGNSH